MAFTFTAVKNYFANSQTLQKYYLRFASENLFHNPQRLKKGTVFQQLVCFFLEFIASMKAERDRLPEFESGASNKSSELDSERNCSLEP